jgi:hypothetical protein
MLSSVSGTGTDFGTTERLLAERLIPPANPAEVTVPGITSFAQAEQAPGVHKHHHPHCFDKTLDYGGGRGWRSNSPPEPVTPPRAVYVIDRYGAGRRTLQEHPRSLRPRTALSRGPHERSRSTAEASVRGSVRDLGRRRRQSGGRLSVGSTALTPVQRACRRQAARWTAAEQDESLTGVERSRRYRRLWRECVSSTPGRSE